MKIGGLRRLPETKFALGIIRVANEKSDYIISEMKIFEVENKRDIREIEEWFSYQIERHDSISIDEEILWMTEDEKIRLKHILNGG